MYISAGALLALVAFGIGVGVAIPAAYKVIKITKSMAGNTGTPAPELTAASKRMRIGSTVSMVILVLVTIFMVAGATL
jgi:cobalamin biosynthesis protein CobD/CbiB